MAKCKLCGTRLEEGVTKCPVCGASVTENGEATSAPAMENITLPTYKCPSCNADIVGEHRFCPQCGINLQEAAEKATEEKAADKSAQEKKCPSCGAVLQDGAKFCPDCGARLGEDASAKEGEAVKTVEADSEVKSALKTEKDSAPQKSEKPKKSKKKIIFGIMAAIVVISTIYTVLDENEPKSTADNSLPSSNNAEQQRQEALRTLLQIKMCRVDGGTFLFREKQNVTVRSFEMAQTEITKEVYEAVMGKNSVRSLWAKELTAKQPVICNIYEAVVFCNKLSIRNGFTPCYSLNGSTNVSEWGAIPDFDKYSELWHSIQCNFSANGYRLATEEEWEYAARGGKFKSSHKYSGSNNIDEVAWHEGNSGWRQGKSPADPSQHPTLPLHDVASKKANDLGIYDLSGNAPEWTWTTSPSVDRIIRGGSAFDPASSCTVFYRDGWREYISLNIGIRLVRTL